MRGDTAGVVKWVGTLLVFLAMFGLLLIFVGGSYKNMDSSKVTVFEGFSPGVYDGAIKFVTVGGVFLIAVMVVAFVVGIKDAFYEAMESYKYK